MSITGVANIKMSLDKYIIDSISGTSIDIEGVPFATEDANSWIQPRILDVTPIFHRQGESSGSSYAENVNILFNVNCFAKVGSVTTAHMHYILRDKVASYFKIGKDISLVNYADSGTTSIDTMRVREIITDAPLPETNELMQYVFAVEMEYTRLTAKP